MRAPTRPQELKEFKLETPKECREWILDLEQLDCFVVESSSAADELAHLSDAEVMHAAHMIYLHLFNEVPDA